jgi:hypothetical protein
MDDLFSLREKEIFDTLEMLNMPFVLIGGYAVNAYTLPRFSVDCDIVIASKEELEKTEKVLFGLGYSSSTSMKDVPYSANFVRYEKIIQPNFRVSIDILIGEVVDRLSGEVFKFDWIVENSKLRKLKGKTRPLTFELFIPDPEALFAMKFASCRDTDIRDMFMLIAHVNLKKLKGILSVRPYFAANFKRVESTISSKEFRNNLAGVYGKLDDKTFERYQKLVSKISD